MKSQEFTDEALAELYDFVRCQRADGTFYGTSGQCRKGTPVGDRDFAKEIEGKTPFAEGGSGELYNVDGMAVKMQEDVYFPDVETEMALQKKAAEAGLAPAVHQVKDLGDEKSMIVMDMIPKGMKNPTDEPMMLEELSPKLQDQGLNLYAKMLKADIVHADYHTGNWFANSKGETQAIDFGIASQLSKPNLKHLTKGAMFILPVLQRKGSPLAGRIQRAFTTSDPGAGDREPGGKLEKELAKVMKQVAKEFS